LTRLKTKPGGAVGEFVLPFVPGEEAFLAVKTGQRIIVGWPQPSDPRLASLVGAVLPNSDDFFDERKLLGSFRDQARSEVYSLVLASRKGKTTLDETRSQPWRLEIYRWKQDDEGRRLMLAGQNYLFRGIGARNESVPSVELSSNLWRVRKDGNNWVAEEQ